MEKNYTQERWEKLGILENVPDERKQKLVDALNFTLDYLLNEENNEQDICSDNYNSNNPQTLPFPILIRIISIIDITDDETLEIINDSRKKYKSYDFSKFGGAGVDCESEFIAEYCENKIKELQEKQK